MNETQSYELTDEAKDQVVTGVIRKIRNAGNINSPESRMVFAIFEQAVKDATWKPLQRDLERAEHSELARRHIREGENARREARRWIGQSLCGHYLGLVGIDHEYATDKVCRLLRLVDA